MFAAFNRFEIQMTMKQARGASHTGDCGLDVEALLHLPKIRCQLEKIGADKIRSELKEYGAWDEATLKDEGANRERILWIAAGDIVDGK